MFLLNVKMEYYSVLSLNLVHAQSCLFDDSPLLPALQPPIQLQGVLVVLQNAIIDNHVPINSCAELLFLSQP